MDDAMTESRSEARALIITFGVLVVLAAGSWIAASITASSALALAIASAKVLAIALVFMELRAAHAVDRVIAIVAVAFIVLITLGALGDVAFRNG
jgi:caa(3)-type oxidase subunit IV